MLSRERRIYLPVRDLAYRNLGTNPCHNCRVGTHRNCSGHHPRNHGMAGMPCTCECATERRIRQKALVYGDD